MSRLLLLHRDVDTSADSYDHPLMAAAQRLPRVQWSLFGVLTRRRKAVAKPVEHEQRSPTVPLPLDVGEGARPGQFWH
jgi:hypothetical protein